MALVSEYDSIIFDYGGVLVHHQTESDQAQMAAMARIPRERFSELYWSDRDAYDRDRVSGSEYWQQLASRAGTELSPPQIEDLTEFDNVSWMRFDPPVWEWIDQLRAAGKRVAVLSNMPRDLGEAIESRTDRFRSFDQVTLSFQVRSVKPEAAIYEHCLEGLGTTPERTLFLDDRIANVQGAELLGIRAIQFLSRDDVLTQVRG